MRLFRFTHRLSILTLIALGLSGCSSKTQLELFERGTLPVQDKDQLFVSRLWSTSKQHGCCVMLRWYPRNDSLDIVKDHIDVIVNLNVWKEQKADFLLQLHESKFEKVGLKKNYLFSFDCFNYLPGGTDVFQEDFLYSTICEDEMRPELTKPAFGGFDHYERRLINVRSPHFDFNFKYPIDYFGFTHSDGYPYRGEDTSDIFISTKDYTRALVRSTGMDLPLSIPLRHFDYSLNLKKFMNKGNLVPVSEFHEDSTYLHLSRRNLHLNPAFIASYQQSIEYLWQLYQFEINYNVFGDTLICDYGRPYAPFREHGKFLGGLIFWFSKYYGIETSLAFYDPVLYIKETAEYLKKVFIEDPKLYSCYFELILWQLFQPTDFEISDSKGRRRAFTFTSRDYRHEGQYEVKFDLMRPFNFKVSKL